MFGLGAATRIYLAAGATDMRKGFEVLHGLVHDRLRCDPLSGHLFVFANAQRNRLKLLFWDGTGLWVRQADREGPRALAAGRGRRIEDRAQPRRVADAGERHRFGGGAKTEMVPPGGIISTPQPESVRIVELERELAWANLEILSLKEQLRLERIRKYGPANEKMITGLVRVSTPGRRIYVTHDKIPSILAGMGVAIVSTSRGVVTDRDARKQKVGGEVLAYVW